VIIRGRLEPEVGAVVMRALTAARDALYRRRQVDVPAGTSVVDGSPEAPTTVQQQADALALVAETALHQGMEPGAPGERYQVVVHVDAQVLADADAPGQSVLEGGARVPAGTSQRLACDASRVVMRHDADGRITEVGARTRTIPPALRRALQHRDKGCRFPGCGLPFGQGHHVKHWAHGGPTKLSNLAMLCRRHHRAVHEEGFQVERDPSGALVFRRPDGNRCPTCPSQLPCRRALRTRCAHRTTEPACRSMRARQCPAGRESVSTSVMQSASCIHVQSRVSERRSMRDRCIRPPSKRRRWTARTPDPYRATEQEVAR